MKLDTEMVLWRVPDGVTTRIIEMAELEDESTLLELERLFRLLIIYRRTRLFFSDAFIFRLTVAIIDRPELHPAFFNSSFIKSNPLITDIFNTPSLCRKFYGLLSKSHCSYYHGFSGEDIIRLAHLYRHQNLLSCPQVLKLVSNFWDYDWDLVPFNWPSSRFDVYLLRKFYANKRDQTQSFWLILALWHRDQLFTYIELDSQDISLLSQLDFQVVTLISLLNKINLGKAEEKTFVSLCNLIINNTTFATNIKGSATLILTTLIKIILPTRSKGFCSLLQTILSRFDAKNLAIKSMHTLLKRMAQLHMTCDGTGSVMDSIFEEFLFLRPKTKPRSEGPLLENEPYHTRFIRWRAVYSRPAIRYDLPFPIAEQHVNLDLLAVKDLLDQNNPCEYLLDLERPVNYTFSNGLVTVCTTILELIEPFLLDIKTRSDYFQVFKALCELGTSLLRATVFQFALTGKWEPSIFPHQTIGVWTTRDSTMIQAYQHELYYLYHDKTPNLPKIDILQTLKKIYDGALGSYFRPEDLVFH